MRRDLERLQDVLEAIERIQQHTGPGRAAFDKEPLVQVWVVHHLNLDAVWAAFERDVPVLRRQVLAIVDAERGTV